LIGEKLAAILPGLRGHLLSEKIPPKYECHKSVMVFGSNRGRTNQNQANRHMRRLLNQVANAAVKVKGSIFEIIYRRCVPRLGHNQASDSLRIDSVV
jgi:hypothetical protein